MSNNKGIRACASCGRDMRPAGTTVLDYPMTISYGRDGACTTCTARVRRSSDRVELPHDGTAPVHLHGGGPIQLVRWLNTRDGWRHEVITGQYGGLDSRHFRVIVNGEERLLPRDQWEVCAA